MPKSVVAAAAACQTNPVDQCRATTVDLLALIRRALQETGWSQDAVAVEMAKDKGYVSRVLSGEKPLSASFVLALPEDVQSHVARRYAESFGLIVVEPVRGDEAVRQLVSGLCGVLVKMPARATRMAKATGR